MLQGFLFLCVGFFLIDVEEEIGGVGNSMVMGKKLFIKIQIFHSQIFTSIDSQYFGNSSVHGKLENMFILHYLARIFLPYIQKILISNA